MANNFKNDEQRANWNRYNNAYSKKHYKAISLKLNLETDKDVIDLLTNSEKSPTQIVRELVLKSLKKEKDNLDCEEKSFSVKQEVRWNNNVRAIREAHDLTQTKLAKILGMSKQGLCFSEMGHVSIKTAKAISDYFGVSVIEVLGLDSFQILPASEEEREYLIKLLKSIDLTKEAK